MARLYSHEFPAIASGVSASHAVEKASHCQCPTLPQQNPRETDMKGQGLFGRRRDSGEEKGKEEGV